MGQDTDQYRTGQPSINKVTAYEAAEALGVTVDAIRKRIQRGTIPHERHEDGRVYILLDEANMIRDASTNTSSTVQDGSGNSSSTVQNTDNSALLERMSGEIEFLRGELQRKDAILLTMAQRIPELEPSQPAPEQRESPETPTPEGAVGGKPSGSVSTGSWWRRFFGL